MIVKEIYVKYMSKFYITIVITVESIHTVLTTSSYDK